MFKNSRKIMACILVICMIFAMKPTDFVYASSKEKVSSAITKGQVCQMVNELLGANVTSDSMKNIVNYKKGDKYYTTMSVAYQAGYIAVNKKNELEKATAKADYGFAAKVFSEILGFPRSKIIGKHKYSDDLTVKKFKAYLAEVFPQVISKNVSDKTYKGNVIINTPNKTLKNITIKGNLVIGDGVADQEVILNNVSVTGKLIVRGGGENSIKIIGSSSISSITIYQANNKVSIKVSEDSDVQIVYIEDGCNDVTLYGPIGTVNIAADNINILTDGATISTVILSGENTTFKVSENTIVNNMVLDKTANNSKLAVDGTVKDITSNATKSIIEVNGNGSVSNITVNDAAAGTEINVSQNAGVSTIVSNAEKTVVMGQGTVKKATINGNNSEVLTPNTEVIEDGKSVNTETQKDQAPMTGNNTPTTGNNTPTENQWTLIWFDEFDKSGTNLDSNGLDLSKWGYQNGTGAEYGLDGWGNNEQQYYSKDNIEVKDGKLVIQPKLETIGTKKYTSGRLWTSPTYAKKYGRFEARIKLPAGEGFWPAFWMMPKNDVYGGWAASGEIDIMEAKGRLLQEVSGTLHYGDVWPSNKYSGANYQFNEGQSITDFHTYAVEWEPGEIRWYVDDKLYQTQTNWNTNGTNGEEKYAFPAPFDQQFYIILNLAVGGNFDSGKEPAASAFESNPKMEVEYVRVYELTGRPYKTPVEPQTTIAALPAGARQADSEGNLVSDVNYTQGININQEGNDANFGDRWNLIYNTQFSGVAAATVTDVDGKKFAMVDVANVGSQIYSVQFEQHTTLGKGRWYEFSFDAKADKNRTLNVKLGGGPDRGWTAYSDSYTVDLTSQVQSFKKVFQMTKDSDIKSRIEFNCATTTGPVWIGNVKVKEVAAPVVDYSASKLALPVSGNLIYNGNFDKYTINRLAYWNVSFESSAAAALLVPEGERELNVLISNPGTAASNIIVDQKGIPLYKKSQYTLSFRARAAADRTISVRLMSKDGTVSYAEKEFNLTTTTSTYELSFEMADLNDLESKLQFMLGRNSSNVIIDDVNLINKTVDYTGVELYPLKNGKFDLGLLTWNTVLDSGGAATFAAVSEAAEINITNLGTNPWSVMLLQEGMHFTQGIEYTLSFRAKAAANRNVAAILENSSYARAFDSKQLQLTSEWQTFNFTVKPTVSEILNLKFLMGNVDATAVIGTVSIDDVVLQVKNPPVKQAPVLIADLTDNIVGNAIDITTQDNAEWRAAIKTVKINDNVILSDKYAIVASNINFTTDNFANAGNYTILIQAEGYTDTSVSQTIKVNNGKIVQNGTFDSNTEGWLSWTGDGSDAAITAEGSELKVNFTNYDGWEIWSTQVYQSGLKLEAGKTYVLTFDARSTIAKNIKIELNKSTGGTHYVNPVVAFTTGMQTYTYEFTTSEADTNAKLNFLLGSNHVEGKDFITHSIFLDNITLKEKMPIPPSLVVNGTFETTLTPWSNWSDGSLSVEAVSGAAVIVLNGFGTNAWSAQFIQDSFHFEKDATYRITFNAKASIARSFGLIIDNAGYYRYLDKVGNLTTEMTPYSYDFVVTADETTKLKFLFGKTGDDITDTVRSSSHSIYLDDIIITKVN